MEQFFRVDAQLAGNIIDVLNLDLPCNFYVGHKCGVLIREGKDINFSIAFTSILFPGWGYLLVIFGYLHQIKHMHWQSSQRLDQVHYDIRGPIYLKALEMEAAGQKIIPLNIGNPAAFGLEVPQALREALTKSIDHAGGYTHQLGNINAREAITQYASQMGILGTDINHVVIGNGVSELILMSMQALLDAGDEVLVPAPDYPLWTAAINLAGGVAVHYPCIEENGWQPDPDEIRKKINKRTKALVVINPNNPTGAVYSLECLNQLVAIAEEFKLVLCSDEIYDHVLFDERKHVSCASLGSQTLFLTYGGISKNHYAAGYRAGWLILSGRKQEASGFMDGLQLLASMRLCSNALAQAAIPVALQNFEQIGIAVRPGGRLFEQKNKVVQRINAMRGLSCTDPGGAMYVFPSYDKDLFRFENDQDFVLQLLVKKHVLLVPGKGFNHHDDQHFRLVFLAGLSQLDDALDRMQELLYENRL
jgi:alanine-synthesizing transaminase